MQNDWPELDFQPIIASMDKFADSVFQFTEAIRKAICTAFAIPIEFILGYYPWERYEGEPFMQWSKRLFNRGLLDDPTIRQEYQAELWREMFNRIRSIVRH